MTDRLAPVDGALSGPLERLARRAEDAGLNASAPPQQRWLDGWLLRFNPGKAKRARCIQAVATGHLPLDERLALCAAVFAAAGLPMVARLTPFSQPAGLDEALAARDWQHADDTRVMLLPTLDGPAPAPRWPAGTRLRLVGHDDYAEVVGGLRGSPAGERAAHAQRLQLSPVPYQGCLLERADDGAVLACGQIATEGDLVGLYDVFTAPVARGQGLASMLCTWLLQQAAARGVRSAYLQVEADNAAARAVYHRLGFADAYAYHYRMPTQ